MTSPTDKRKLASVFVRLLHFKQKSFLEKITNLEDNDDTDVQLDDDGQVVLF
jgi:hypothetical protein